MHENDSSCKHINVIIAHIFHFFRFIATRNATWTTIDKTTIENKQEEDKKNSNSKQKLLVLFYVSVHAALSALEDTHTHWLIDGIMIMSIIFVYICRSSATQKRSTCWNFASMTQTNVSAADCETDVFFRRNNTYLSHTRYKVTSCAPFPKVTHLIQCEILFFKLNSF